MNKVSRKPKVAIVGANGYAGLVLARLLLHHPFVELSAIFTRKPDWKLEFDLPELKAKEVAHYSLEDNFDISVHSFDVVFLATPAETSLEIAPLWLKQGVTVIDLSPAFRFPGSEPSWSGQALYGLSPWWTVGHDASDVRFIANPGCYSTCILMALLPLVKSNLIQRTIIIDAKSGVSGAGRKAETHLLYSELANNFYPYKIGCHPHVQEISKYLEHFGNFKTTPLLTTHLLPVKRGLSASIYAELNLEFCHKTENEIAERIQAAYDDVYSHYPLVKHAYLKNSPQHFLGIKQVVGSARTHIGYQIQEKHLLVFSSIDNLLKGAASQAVENFNALYQLPLETGLQQWEGTL